MKNISLFFSTIFVIGIVWYVSINFNIVIFAPMAVLLIIYIYEGTFRLDSEYIAISFYVLAIFIFWAILNITAYNQYDDYIASRFLKISIFSFLVMFFTFLFYNDREEFLAKSIDNAILVIVILWWVQFIVYYSSGEYLDYLNYVSSRTSRYQAYWIQASLPIQPIRPTSIFVEPGTYAVNTFPLLALSYTYHKRVTPLHVVLLVSYFFSISLFAILIGILFITATQLYTFEFRWSKKNIFLLFLFSLLFLGLSWYLYFRFVVQGGTDQVGYREDVIGFWLSLSSHDMVFGQGMAQVVIPNRAMIEDASFLFRIFFDYGFFSIPYLLLLFYVSFGFPIVFVLIMLITKIGYTLYIMWFYIAAMAILNKDRRRGREDI